MRGGRRWALLLALALGSALSGLAGAQDAGKNLAGAQDAGKSAPPAGTGMQVYHVAVGQGAVYFEKYGHNMLWFRDPAAGIDVAYNWGLFDFAQPGFLRRLLAGDPLYWVEGYPGDDILRHYRLSDRTITLQRLNLTPEQARRAYAFAAHNALPENRYYRYDYFRDNCSTRVRDVIDHALGGALRRATGDTVDLTYRSEAVRLVDELKLTQFGVHVALGQPADRRLTTWESMFIPMRMRDALRLVRLPDEGGRALPLVAEERVVHESSRYRDRASNAVLWVPYLVIGLLLGLEFLAVGALGKGGSRAVQVVFRVEVAIFALVTGMMGVLLLLAWMFTRHEYWFRNENLLLMNPLSLFLAALVLPGVWRPRIARGAAITATIVAGAAALGLVLKVLPAFDQDNLALISLLLPAHLAIAFGLHRVARSSRDGST